MRHICYSLILLTCSFSSIARQLPKNPNAGLAVPAKFKATLLIDRLGSTRHLTVTPNNMLYVRLAKTINGKGTLLLTQHDGIAEVKSGFGNFGGTGIYLKKDYLYTSSNSEVFRYKLNSNYEVIDPEHPEKLVTGLVDQGTHETKSIVVDDEGKMYIPIGCPSNSCQVADRQMGSMGQPGCPLLNTSGGVWQFRSDALNQSYSSGLRYATGLRNVVGVDWNSQSGQLFVMQHGRDQLNNIFPRLYTTKESAQTPAECMYALKEGDDAGWPYIYYDGERKKKIISPEYGGDKQKEGSSKYLDPAAFYPAHMAPNGLLFYTGNQFPARYKNGAFIAFHGSWNRSPEPQAGYFVVFQPFANGKPTGSWEIFVDGFSGSAANTASGRAERRPCGLAQGPDGALYISDDVKGAIFKITYDPLAAQPSQESEKLSHALPEIHKKKPSAKQNFVSYQSASMRKTMENGKKLYLQHCAVCHQPDGAGVQNLNPTLVKTSWVLGSKDRLINVLLQGLSQQKIDGESYRNPMPAFNYLKDQQIADILTFVRGSFGNKADAVTRLQVETVRHTKKNP